MIIISTHAPRMIPSEHLSRQRAGMNGIFDLSLVKNISLGKRFEFFDHEIMKLALIAIGLLCRSPEGAVRMLSSPRCSQAPGSRLLYDLISSREQRGRHIEPEGLRGLQVDHQLVLGRRLHWEICARCRRAPVSSSPASARCAGPPPAPPAEQSNSPCP